LVNNNKEKQGEAEGQGPEQGRLEEEGARKSAPRNFNFSLHLIKRKGRLRSEKNEKKKHRHKIGKKGQNHTGLINIYDKEQKTGEGGQFTAGVVQTPHETAVRVADWGRNMRINTLTCRQKGKKPLTDNPSGIIGGRRGEPSDG